MSALVEVRDLVKHYPIRSGIVFRHEIRAVQAVNGISSDLDAGRPSPSSASPGAASRRPPAACCG